MDHAVAELDRIGSPEWWKTASILRLWGSTSATSRLTPSSSSSIGQTSEQHGAEPELLPAVSDHEGDLGLQRILQPIEPGDGDDLVACCGHDGLTAVWSTWVKRYSSSSLNHGCTPKNRRYVVSGDNVLWNRNSPAASAARIGCSRTVVPSRSSPIRDRPAAASTGGALMTRA